MACAEISEKADAGNETCPWETSAAGSPLNVWDCLPFSYLPS